MFVYRKATFDDLNKIWDNDIKENDNEVKWVLWKEQYIKYNKTGMATTFVVLYDNNPIGQITILFSTECSAVLNRSNLCDGRTTANMNAFRIKKEYEGQGHISKLVKMAEEYAKQKGIEYLTIGCEAKESRNLSIYLHFGYTQFVDSFIEDNDLILFYRKRL
ncbi:MAG: GNAT family N-acetyltransferase [Clostridia bacterium]|nr:GNAT family N-acetyltransferase [Clostridia bacterium]